MGPPPGQREDLPERPAEAALIHQLRERAPRMSRRQAAAQAGISPARWEQLENGYRMFRGQPYAEQGPPGTIARMAGVVGATPGQLRDAGRPDAAAELEALLLDAEMMPTKGQAEVMQSHILRQARKGDRDA